MTNPLPEQFLERLRIIIPEKKLPLVLMSLQTLRPRSFRINTLKITHKECLSELKSLKIPLEPVLGFPNAFILKDSEEKLTKTDCYKKGYVYIQNLSSMIPALILDPKPGERILDIAAALGSKTTQIAAYMENKGEILANDRSRERIYKLTAVLKQYGVSFSTQRHSGERSDSRIRNESDSGQARMTDELVTIANFPGEMLWKFYPEYFDKALVDVPCSMEGRVSTLDPETYKDWTLRKIKSLIQTQRYLLRSAVSCTKPEGLIVYSTCTLAPEENEGIIDWLLRTEKGAVELEEIKIENLELSEGLTHWKNKVFDRSLTKTARVWPSSLMEGFYVAKIRKLRSTIAF